MTNDTNAVISTAVAAYIVSRYGGMPNRHR